MPAEASQLLSGLVDSVHLYPRLETLRAFVLRVKEYLALLRVQVFLLPLLPFAKPIPGSGKMWLHHDGVFDKLLHAINKSIPIAAAR